VFNVTWTGYKWRSLSWQIQYGSVDWIWYLELRMRSANVWDMTAYQLMHALHRTYCCKVSCLSIPPVLIECKLTEREHMQGITEAFPAKHPLNLLHSPSSSAGSSQESMSLTGTLAGSTPNPLNGVTSLLTPYTHGFAQLANKKRWTKPLPSPSPLTITSSPSIIPLKCEKKTS
jgi:hypothetical protein